MSDDLADHRPLENAKKRLRGAIAARRSGADRFGTRLGVKGKILFDLRGKATFGDRINVHGHITPVEIVVRKGGILTVGSDIGINYGVSIEVWHEVRIGNGVTMAPYVSIIDDNRHEMEPGAVLYKGPIIIEDNVWFGRNVAVMPGVTIGEGSVIAANAVVTKDIPPHVMAGGVPAKVIKKLAQPDGWIRD
jgi:acetyltransferase-like isoleucine patch superfamily enzyme